jgi:hypothetical protein
MMKLEIVALPYAFFCYDVRDPKKMRS